ncbi:hypothetical protein AB3S75_000980 [Citrus x aurantiifolia]
MLMNLKTLDWDKPTLETPGIPAEILPRIVSNSEIIGKIGKGWPITGIPISGCLGDQHAAMLGQACKKGFNCYRWSCSSVAQRQSWHN